jgi:F-type H+-transporting ATPase subunit gamma
MANLRDIRRRIRSVNNTAQITRAMQMVAAAKMRKAQQSAVQGRPYATLLGDVLREVSTTTAHFQHALMATRPVRMTAVVLVSTDKGLCGSMNSNLFREIMRYDPDTTVFVAVGRKGAQFVTRARRRLIAEFTWRETHLLGMARMVSRFVSGLFLDGDIDRAELVYTHFISTLNQEPRHCPFLPVSEMGCMVSAMGMDGETPGGAPAERSADRPADRLGGCIDFAFEPSIEDVLQPLLILALDFHMYQIVLESRASENSARMVAMKNATDNAHDLVRELTLDYNKLRQAAITSELIEISSGLSIGG